MLFFSFFSFLSFLLCFVVLFLLDREENCWRSEGWSTNVIRRQKRREREREKKETQMEQWLNEGRVNKRRKGSDGWEGLKPCKYPVKQRKEGGSFPAKASVWDLQIIEFRFETGAVVSLKGKTLQTFPEYTTMATKLRLWQYALCGPWVRDNDG